jgi:hypothetical protein
LSSCLLVHTWEEDVDRDVYVAKDPPPAVVQHLVQGSLDKALAPHSLLWHLHKELKVGLNIEVKLGE